MGLQLAKELHVYVDSLLLTNHFNGSNAVKSERLALYVQILKMLAYTLTNFSLNQTFRKDNARADTLASLGSSLRSPPEAKILIVHIMIQIIENPTKMPEDITTHDQIASIGAVKDPDLYPLLHDPDVLYPGPYIQDLQKHGRSIIQ